MLEKLIARKQKEHDAMERAGKGGGDNIVSDEEIFDMAGVKVEKKQ